MESFAGIIGARLRKKATDLSQRWLERLNDILTIEPNEIFPTDDLLDHIPQLIEQIADYVEAPAVEELAANSGVVSKARELGLLRHGQKASVHQLLREYHLLGAIVETFLQEQMTRLPFTPPPADVLKVAARVSHALRILQQTTIDTFIAEYTDRIATQQARLEGFNKLVSHELRQPLGTLQFSVRLLGSDQAVDPERRARLFEIVEMNLQRLVHLTGQLERVARVQHRGEAPSRQEVDISVLAREVARQLREMADHRGVEVRTAPDLPVVVTDLARLELILINLVSNGIKYLGSRQDRAPRRHLPERRDRRRPHDLHTRQRARSRRRRRAVHLRDVLSRLVRRSHRGQGHGAGARHRRRVRRGDRRTHHGRHRRRRRHRVRPVAAGRDAAR